MAQMTTTAQNDLSPTHNETHQVFYLIDDVDKTTYLAIQGTLIVLTFLLNVTVIGVIVYLYVKRATVSGRSCHFIPVLACCVAELVEGVYDSVLFNMYRERRYAEPYGWTCQETVAVELSGFIFAELPLLLVAAVIVTQAVGLQQVMTLTRRVEKIVAVVLVGLSVLYLLVLTIPLFYMTYLEGDNQVCVQLSSGDEYVNFQTDRTKSKVLPAFDYIVPSILIFLSSVLLLLAYCIPNNRTNFMYHNNDAFAFAASQGSSSARSAVTRPPFPFNSFLAALSCILLNVVFFTYLFRVFESDRDVMSGVWLWGRTLSKLNGVVLPCCWLFDADIRVLWCCCGNRSRAPPEVVALESAE